MVRRIALGLALAMAVLLPTAAPAAPQWSTLSTEAVANFAEPALLRTDDGVLHVLWVQDEQLYQTPVAGHEIGEASPVLTDWSSMWGGGGDLVEVSDGTLRYFFGGVRGSFAGDPNDNLNMLTSDAAGTAWTLMTGNVVDPGVGPSASSTTIGAGSALDGTPFQTYGGWMHRGTDPAVAPINVAAAVNASCCHGDADLVTDQVTGEMFFVWRSTATDHRGIWAHQIDPVTGALIGEPMLMPSVNYTTSEGGEPQVPNGSTRVPTAAPPLGETYVAYIGGFEKKVVVWRMGSETARTVAKRDKGGLGDPALASDPNDKLWVAWSQGGRLWFRRSSGGVAGWGAPVSVKPPGFDDTTIFDIKLNASDKYVDVIAVLDRTDGPPTVYHRWVKPGMNISARPSTFEGQRRVRFRVTDVTDPIQGVVIRVDGHRARTDAAGEAVIRLGPYRTRKRLLVSAKHPDYTPNTMRITARP